MTRSRSPKRNDYLFTPTAVRLDGLVHYQFGWYTLCLVPWESLYRGELDLLASVTCLRCLANWRP